MSSVGGVGSSSTTHVSRENIARDVFSSLRSQLTPTEWSFLKNKIHYNEDNLLESLDKLDAFIDENPIKEFFSKKDPYQANRIQSHIRAALKKDPKMQTRFKILTSMQKGEKIW